MELSDFIKIRVENYESKNNAELESHQALGFVEIAKENILDLYAKDIVQGVPIDWTEIRRNVGAMMTGIVNFCHVNSIDLKQVLDMNVDKLIERKLKEEIKPKMREGTIEHNEIFDNKPFTME